MNTDIVYEIFRQLHLDGSALIAKRLILSTKSFGEIEKRKIEKPIVLVLKQGYMRLPRLDHGSVIYFEDGSKKVITDRTQLSTGRIVFQYNQLGQLLPDHIIEKNEENIVRIFGHKSCLQIPPSVKNVLSIGELQDLSGMFKNGFVPREVIGSRWDTSNVINMSKMFYGSVYVQDGTKEPGDRKTSFPYISRNWNTSKVKDMSLMFAYCSGFYGPLGKNWEMSDTTDTRLMFHNCSNPSRQESGDILDPLSDQ